MTDDVEMRVWSEFLPFEDLAKPDVIGLLKQFHVGLNVAVHHDKTFDQIESLVRKYQDSEVPIALWILLSKDEGYFPSERNYDKFRTRVFSVMDMLESRDLKAPDIAVDLELPLNEMEMRRSKNRADRKQFRRRMKTNVDPLRFEESTRAFKKINEEIHERGAKTLVAASPTIADDLRHGDLYTQDLLETPITTVHWDRISIMWYVSMLTGYSKGLIPYDAARWQLLRDADIVVNCLGAEHASVSLGVTWTGVLGDEPYYRKPCDMRPDVEAAKAAGVRHIWIYNLEGILKAERPADWFEMVMKAEPKIPRQTLTARVSTPARDAALWFLKRIY